MSPERAGALATALSLSRVQRARLRAAFYIKAAVGTAPIDYDGFCRAVAELGHVCFCRAVDVEGVGRVWTPAKDDDPLRALFRVISSSKAFYAAQKNTATLW